MWPYTQQNVKKIAEVSPDWASELPRVTLLYVCQVNKLMSVFHVSVLLLTMNFDITLSKLLWIHEAIAEWIRRFKSSHRPECLSINCQSQIVPAREGAHFTDTHRLQNNDIDPGCF